MQIITYAFAFSGMMGYNVLDSCEKHLEHHLKLRDNNANLHAELNHLYKWISDKNFLDALRLNASNQWVFVQKAMLYPPVKIIESFQSKCEALTIDRIPLKRRRRMGLNCNLCQTKLADSIEEKIQYATIKCACGTRWCHQECANNSIIQNGQCGRCKEYYTLNLMNKALRSTVSNHV